MRILLGEGGEGGGADEALLAGERPVPADRPWVTANMVASVDGATAVEGESRGLSGPADRRVFHALRGIADAVMAAAGTVRADRYGPARPSEATRAARRARGQRPVPPIVVVSRSLDLPWSAPLFAEAEVPTVVLAPGDVAADALRRATAAGADLIAVGAGSVDLGAALRTLRRRGVGHLLCEGGPGLIAALAGADLLDELFVTVSPLLVGGDAARVLRGASLLPPRPVSPVAVAEEDGFLFLRYRVASA